MDSDWEERLGDAAETKTETTTATGRSTYTVHSGQQSDLFAGSSGGLFAAGFAGLLWFCSFHFDLFYTPWWAVLFALLLTLGVRAGAGAGGGGTQTLLAMTIYIFVGLLILLIISYVSAGLHTTGFDYAALETEFTRFISEFENWAPLVVGAGVIVALTWWRR